MAMFFLRHGLNAPLVISPTTLPSGVDTTLCWRAGAPLDTKPTRRLLHMAGARAGETRVWVWVDTWQWCRRAGGFTGRHE